MASSPVMDAGANSLAMDPNSQTPLATDQRGVPFVRIADGLDANDCHGGHGRV